MAFKNTPADAHLPTLNQPLAPLLIRNQSPQLEIKISLSYPLPDPARLSFHPASATVSSPSSRQAKAQQSMDDGGTGATAMPPPSRPLGIPWPCAPPRCLRGDQNARPHVNGFITIANADGRADGRASDGGNGDHLLLLRRRCTSLGPCAMHRCRLHALPMTTRTTNFHSIRNF